MKNTKEKREKEKKKAKINNHGFLPFVVGLSIAAILSLAIQIWLYSKDIKWSNLNFDSLSIASQIITAIVICILQILGISLSLQSAEWNGMKMYEIRQMRRDKHFSLLATTIISIVLLLVNIICYNYRLFIICIGCCVCALALCIYVLCVEMPILTMHESALMGIVKNQIAAEDVISDKILQEKFNQTLDSLISKKEIGTIYRCFMVDGDLAYNKKLLMCLFDSQERLGFDLDSFINSGDLKKVALSMLSGIRNILNGSFDITKILGENDRDYIHCIMRPLFQLLESNYAQEVIEGLCQDVVWYNKDPALPQSKLFEDVIILIAIDTIKRGNFKFVSGLRKQFSLHPFTFQESISGLIFSILSFSLYYLAELCTYSSAELKKSIRDFISFSGIEDNVRIVSWKALFERFSYGFNLKYSDYIEMYHKHSYNIENLPLSGFMQAVPLSENDANNWYLANLFNKEDCFDDDYSSILKDLTHGQLTYYLETFIKENYQDKEFIPSEKIKKMIEFYSDRKPFASFISDENSNHRFYDYYDNLSEKKLDKESEECKNISNEDLVKKYEQKIKEKLESEWNFDSSIDLSKVEPRYMSLYYEKKSKADNHDECLLNAFTNGVFYDIFKKISANPLITTIKCDEEDAIESLLGKDIEGITGYAISLAYNIKNINLRNSFFERIKGVLRIKSNILTDAFGLIAIVATTPLVVIQIVGLIYKYKTKKIAYKNALYNEEIIDY